MQLHHHFSSRFLIDSLNSHGFCCSYSEVQRFERSASVLQGTDIPNLTPDQVVQYAADNVDHNKITIDGRNTFHGMGIIATVTPGTKSSYHILRITVPTEDICSIGHVKIYFATDTAGIKLLSYHRHLLYLMQKIQLQPLMLFGKPHFNCIQGGQEARMVWSNANGAERQTSRTVFCFYLPMIDMNPSDLSCVYSILCYVSSHAKRYNVTPIVTFDQPLWWKALEVRESAPEDNDLHSIVLCHGGFHTIMSFLGCIGHVM